MAKNHHLLILAIRFIVAPTKPHRSMYNPVDRAIKAMMLGAGVVSVILFLVFKLM